MSRLLLAVLALLLAACGGDPAATPSGDEEAGPTAADGYAVEAVLDGLEGPTQLAVDGEGRWWLAQLAGAEGAAQGEVVVVEPQGDTSSGGAPQVVLDGLAKPTGLALSDDALWVVTEDEVLRAPRDGAEVGEPEVVLTGLPNNGRSNGTITPAPDGTLWFDTSGALAGDRPAEDSATLWSLDPVAAADGGTVEPEPVATGFKHAYAVAFADDGTAWTTEMGDGRYDGEPMPDAVHLVDPDAAVVDHGWPRCVGDRRPVAEHGGDEAGCAEVPRPVALFDPGSTPTGIAVAPWDPDTLLVALWVRGDVVAVPAATDTSGDPATPTVVASGLDGPQHLLVDGDGVLLTEHGTGRVLRLTRDDG